MLDSQPNSCLISERIVNLPGFGEVLLKTSYTVREAARLLRFGKSTVYDAIERGEVPVIRMGSRMRVPGHFVNSKLLPPDQARAA